MRQTGDADRVKCPHCKKVIRPPAVVKGVEAGRVLETTGTCPLCGKENHFWARLAIRVDAERESKVV